jgi:hypothetical protein
VRQFVQNIPSGVSQGYYYGSDQYVWGREFLQRNASEPRELEIQKHWFQWLLWGRLAYDPQLDNRRLQAILAERYDLSPEQSSQLFNAWQSSSMVYPITTGFHWGALDFQWYIEGCQSRPSFAQNETGFHDVNRFINLAPHAESNCLSIPDYVAAAAAARTTDKSTPLEVADQLDRHAQRAMELSGQIPVGESGELQRTLADIRIVAHLGFYYADKIRGATQLAVARERSDETARNRAIEHLADAARHWHDYACLALKYHKNPLWTNRVGLVDWRENFEHVLADIRIAGGDPAAHNLPASIDVDATAPERPYEIRSLQK